MLVRIVVVFHLILLNKLIRERMYGSACLLMSHDQGGLSGDYNQTDSELTFSKFADSPKGRALAWAAARQTP